MRKISYIEHIYDKFLILCWIVYFAVLFGVGTQVPEYLSMMDSIIKYFVSIFLIFQFNPFKENLIMADSAFNKKIAYHGGLFIFLTSGISDTLKAILDNKFGLSDKDKQILIPS